MCSHTDHTAPTTNRHPLVPLNFPFIWLIHLYRFTLSPLLGGQCRFQPTCSQYGLDAYRTHHALKATSLTLGRLLRCQPLAKPGHDPVPRYTPGRRKTHIRDASSPETGP